MHEAIVAVFKALVDVWALNTGRSKVGSVAKAQTALALKGSFCIDTISSNRVAIMATQRAFVDVGAEQWAALSFFGSVRSKSIAISAKRSSAKMMIAFECLRVMHNSSA